MDTSLVTQLGVGGIFAILILKEVFGFVSKKSRSESDEQVDQIAKEVRDLWEWHNVTDPSTGGKIWYVQRSLEKAMDRLSENIEAQTAVMQRLVEENNSAHTAIVHSLEMTVKGQGLQKP